MSTDTYPYNDDLLIHADDQKHAKQMYGPLAYALIFPELIDAVTEADALANDAKKRVRRYGLASVAMVTVALLAASGASLLEGMPCAEPLLVFAALLGVVGALGGFGLFSKSAKDEWLENRLVTESLRQFHFRSLVAWSPEILRIASSANEAEPLEEAEKLFADFYARRSAALADLQRNLIDRKAEEFSALIGRREQRRPPEIDPMPGPEMFKGEHGRKLLVALGSLRLLRQRQYADHKLKDAGGVLSKFPRRQAKILGWASLACVLLLFGLHLVSAGLPMFSLHAPGTEPSTHTSKWLHQLAIWAAIVALALRALEEGLKPRTEIERYQHYQITTERLLDRFDNGDTAEKLRMLRALENSAYDEMVHFLRSYHEARFVM